MKREVGRKPGALLSAPRVILYETNCAAGMLFLHFHLPPGHDSWVVGDAPYVSLHVSGCRPLRKQVVGVLLSATETHELIGDLWAS